MLLRRLSLSYVASYRIDMVGSVFVVDVGRWARLPLFLVASVKVCNHCHVKKKVQVQVGTYGRLSFGIALI